MKIVRDAIHDYWRRRRVVFDISTIDEARLALLPDFEADIDRQRRAALLRQAIRLVESSKRETLELFYESNLSIAEISRMLGKSESAIKTELMRTRRALAEIVRDLSNKRSRL